MPALNCYNYTTHNAARFQVGLINSNDAQSITSGTYSTSYGDCVVTKDETAVSIRVPVSIDITNGTISEILSAVGIRNSSPIAGDIVGKIPDGTSADYGFNRNFSSPPYFRYSKVFNTFDETKNFVDGIKKIKTNKINKLLQYNK